MFFAVSFCPVMHYNGLNDIVAFAERRRQIMWFLFAILSAVFAAVGCFD